MVHDVPAREARLGDDDHGQVGEPRDDGDGDGGALGRAHGGSYPGAGLQLLDHVVEDGGDGREVDGDAGEGVEDAEGGGVLVDEDEEAVREADDAVALELWQGDAEAPGGGRVEEGHRARVGRADAVAVAERDPAKRAEARVPEGGVARAGRRRAPPRAHTEEGDVVQHVDAQQPCRDEVQ